MTPRAPVPHVIRPRGRARTRLGRFLEGLGAVLALPGIIAGALAALLASRLAMPGVTVLTGARPASSELTTAPGSTYFVVGQAERGDTAAPVLVRSLAEFVENFGNRVTYSALYDDLETFFREGGDRAYVTRVVGPAATTGLLNLLDRAGAPIATVRLTAKSAGAWSSTLTASVADGAVANTVTLSLFLAGELVELYQDLADPAALTAAINARSRYVVATNLGSATAAPANNPAVLAATALSAGTDDRASLVAATYTAALDRFTIALGTGAVAIPGQVASAVGAGLIAHARAYRRIALLNGPAGQTDAAAKADAAAYRALGGSEHAGYFHLWVIVPDGSGGTRTIAPAGYVAAMRARAHRLEGPWRAPAGDIAVADFVVAPERELTRAQIDDLANSRVNVLRRTSGVTRLYGWRSLSLDVNNYLLLTARDSLNVLAAIVDGLLERYVFRNIDSKRHLFGEVETDVRAILEPWADAGGLYARTDAAGRELDPGYSIDTGPAVNTVATLAANELRVDVGIRLSPTAELVRVTITKVAFDSSL